MAGQDDGTAAGARGHAQLRVSHADREQVIDLLKTAFVHGRLTKAEFDLRVGQALTSRVYADLAVLTADIPAGLAGARPPRAGRKPAARQAVRMATGMAAVWAVLWLKLAVLDWQGVPDVASLVLLVLLAPVALAGLVLLHSWLDKRAGRQPSQGSSPARWATGEQPSGGLARR